MIANGFSSRDAELINAAVVFSFAAEGLINFVGVEIDFLRGGCSGSVGRGSGFGKRACASFTAFPCPAMCMYITRGDSRST